MLADVIEKISAIIGAVGVAGFVLGLAAGISGGFAGFWGGLPFWVISLSVLVLVFYDLWDSTIRKKKPSD
jgi:uncharacterized membrane protein